MTDLTKLNSKKKKCPECGEPYVYMDLHWINCVKNPEAIDLSNPNGQQTGGNKAMGEAIAQQRTSNPTEPLTLDPKKVKYGTESNMSYKPKEANLKEIIFNENKYVKGYRTYTRQEQLIEVKKIIATQAKLEAITELERVYGIIYNDFHTTENENTWACLKRIEDRIKELKEIV